VIRAPTARLVGLIATLVGAWPAVTGASWDWVTSAEGDAVTRSVATDAAGNVYVAGSFQTVITLGAVTLTAVNGSADAFLLKLAPDGDVIWGRSAGGWRQERCWGVACDPAGRVYVTGDFGSNDITFDTVTLENNYQTPYIDDSTLDVFTACYSADGDILWARKAGGMWHDSPAGIVHDGTESVYIAGTFFSSVMVFDTVSVSNSGNVDLFLARYDEDGVGQWARSAVGNGQESAWSLAVDSDNAVYIAGSYRSPTLTFGSHILTNTSTDFDLYVAKCEPGGSVRWVTSAYGQEWDDATAIGIDEWGHVLVAGHFDSDTLRFGAADLVLSDNENANVDMYLARLDGDGRVDWATSSTGAAWPYPYSVCAWSTNRIAVTGTFTECNFGDTEYFGAWPVTSHGSYDIFLVDYDVDGTPLSAENYGGTDMDFGQDICRDDEGNLFLGAFFSSDSLVMDPFTLTNDHFNKMLVGKRQDPFITAVQDTEPGVGPSARRTILLNSPNPFNAGTKISYDVEVEGAVRLDVFDACGRLVRTLVDGVQSAGRHTAFWDGRDARGSDVASGVYLLRLHTATSNGSGKVTRVE
jgi:hypothetical protein